LIAADGRIAFQEDTLELNEISSVVKKIIDESPSQVFKIKADASANSGIVIDTLEILRDSGAKKTLLLTTKDN
jgi:biopolymer transport protein ExbD